MLPFLPDFLTLGTSSNTAEEGHVLGYHFFISSYYLHFSHEIEDLHFGFLVVCFAYATHGQHQTLRKNSIHVQVCLDR